MWNAYLPQYQPRCIPTEEIAELGLPRDKKVFFYSERDRMLYVASFGAVADYVEQLELWEEIDAYLFDKTMDWVVAITHEDLTLCLGLCNQEAVDSLTIQKCGSLCFWGDWFGRPMDNIHTPVSASFDETEKLLVIQFDRGETCEIFGARGIVNTWNDFYVEKADRIGWSWYYYGRGRTPENLFRREYILEDGTVVCTEYHRERLVGRERFSAQGERAFSIC